MLSFILHLNLLNVALGKIRITASLLNDFPEPSDGLLVILLHAFTILIHPAQAHLGNFIALLSGFAIPMWKRRGCQVCLWKNSV